MKKVNYFLGVAILATILISSCSKKNTVESITLDKDSLEFAVGVKIIITATVLPDNADNKTVTWISSKPSVASVENGKVTGVSVGTATITAKAGSKTATCFVNVIVNPNYDAGVMIGDVKWATRNVEFPGTFADTPESAGMFYQWNRNICWEVTGEVTGWNSSNPIGTTWEKSNDPCPTGWRVPTKSELEGLLSSDYNWTDTPVNGYIFGSGSNTIFLPFVGWRNNSDGALFFPGNAGEYWSSTSYDEDNSYFLGLGDGESVYHCERNYGMSVRCVAE